MDAHGSWGGYNTTTLVSEGMMYLIHPSELKPGDAIGICGPTSAGNNGHIMLFEAWYNNVPQDNRCWIWEQAGGVNGPRRRLIQYPFGSYRSWRLATIQDDPAGSVLRRPWPSYMPANEYFGDMNGPNASHGGYYAIERPDVKAIQQRLITLGYVPGVTLTTSAWADGYWQAPTTAACQRWQSHTGANHPGQIWQDDWNLLFTF
jgi:hypothetical protein